MKKKALSLVLTAFAFLVFFTGCNKETNPIVGNWKLDLADSYYKYIAVHNTAKGIDIITGATYQDENGNTVEFREMADLNITSSSWTFQKDGTAQIIYTKDGKSNTLSGQYSATDAKLTFDGKEWTITTLDENKLVLDIEYPAAAEKGTNLEQWHLVLHRN